jgi:hypothetical protein
VSGEHVTVEHQHRLVRARLKPVGDVPDRPAGPERDVLGDVDQLDTEPGAVTEVLREDLRLVRGPQHHAGDARGPGAGDLVLGARDPGDREHRLGRGDRQRT